MTTARRRLRSGPQLIYSRCLHLTLLALCLFAGTALASKKAKTPVPTSEWYKADENWLKEPNTISAHEAKVKDYNLKVQINRVSEYMGCGYGWGELLPWAANHLDGHGLDCSPCLACNDPQVWSQATNLPNELAYLEAERAELARKLLEPRDDHPKLEGIDEMLGRSIADLKRRIDGLVSGKLEWTGPDDTHPKDSHCDACGGERFVPVDIPQQDLDIIVPPFLHDYRNMEKVVMFGGGMFHRLRLKTVPEEERLLPEGEGDPRKKIEYAIKGFTGDKTQISVPFSKTKDMASDAAKGNFVEKMRWKKGKCSPEEKRNAFDATAEQAKGFLNQFGEDVRGVVVRGITTEVDGKPKPVKTMCWASGCYASYNEPVVIVDVGSGQMAFRKTDGTEMYPPLRPPYDQAWYYKDYTGECIRRINTCKECSYVRGNATVNTCPKCQSRNPETQIRTEWVEGKENPHETWAACDAADCEWVGGDVNASPKCGAMTAAMWAAFFYEYRVGEKIAQGNKEGKKFIFGATGDYRTEDEALTRFEQALAECAPGLNYEVRLVTQEEEAGWALDDAAMKLEESVCRHVVADDTRKRFPEDEMKVLLMVVDMGTGSLQMAYYVMTVTGLSAVKCVRAESDEKSAEPLPTPTPAPGNAGMVCVDGVCTLPEKNAFRADRKAERVTSAGMDAPNYAAASPVAASPESPNVPTGKKHAWKSASDGEFIAMLMRGELSSNDSEPANDQDTRAPDDGRSPRMTVPPLAKGPRAPVLKKYVPESANVTDRTDPRNAGDNTYSRFTSAEILTLKTIMHHGRDEHPGTALRRPRLPSTDQSDVEEEPVPEPANVNSDSAPRRRLASRQSSHRRVLEDLSDEIEGARRYTTAL